MKTANEPVMTQRGGERRPCRFTEKNGLVGCRKIMSKTNNTIPAPAPSPGKVERGLSRLHRNLRLIALGAPEFIIAESQRLLDESITETGLTEAALAKIYPRYRLKALGLEALAAAEDDCASWQNYDDPEEAIHGATDD